MPLTQKRSLLADSVGVQGKKTIVACTILRNVPQHDEDPFQCLAPTCH
uniref:Uncharacterized protein n=1 Tax=Arundo donax TaxID=35708 RepID=A0A0A9HHN5_ARUDO